MKKLLVILFSVCIVSACNNSSITEGSDNTELKDPATVQPSSEKIPDTMTIKKDSVVVPETNSDSAR